MALSFTCSVDCVRESTGIKATSPVDIAMYCKDMAKSAQEMFVVIDFDTRQNVIESRMVSLGLLDQSLVHPREIFRGAIANSAKAIAIVHNHPSGILAPSLEDIRITQKINEGGNILGIQVLDHVIVGGSEGAFFSMRESGIVNFER